jgi:protein-tyrosine phosphatase
MAQRQRETVVFLCTGNYYRSRFAEILFNSVAASMGLPWQAVSRGLALERGVNNVGPIEVSVLAALRALGVEGGDALVRFPAAVTAEDLEQAARIVALQEVEHRPLVIERFPAWVGKVEYWDIDDAPGALALIEVEVRRFVAHLRGD